LAGLVAKRALATARGAVKDAEFALDVAIFDRAGALLAKA